MSQELFTFQELIAIGRGEGLPYQPASFTCMWPAPTTVVTLHESQFCTSWEFIPPSKQDSSGSHNFSLQQGSSICQEKKINSHLCPGSFPSLVYCLPSQKNNFRKKIDNEDKFMWEIQGERELYAQERTWVFPEQRETRTHPRRTVGESQSWKKCIIKWKKPWTHLGQRLGKSTSLCQSS